MADSAKIPDDVDILHYPVGKSKTINGILKLLRRKWSVQISENGKDEFLFSDESVILDLKLVESAEAAEVTHPLKCVGIGTTVRVYYGGVGTGIPTNFNDGDDPPLILSSLSSSGVIYCPVARVAETGVLTTGAITHSSTFPTDSPTEGIAKIASYSVTDGVVSIGQIAGGTLYTQYCGITWLWGT